MAFPLPWHQYEPTSKNRIFYVYLDELSEVCGATEYVALINTEKVYAIQAVLDDKFLNPLVLVACLQFQSSQSHYSSPDTKSYVNCRGCYSRYDYSVTSSFES